MQLHMIYQQALKDPAQPPLRFAPKVDVAKTPPQLFAAMETNDIWDDANLWPVFDYLFSCKYIRTAGRFLRVITL